MSGLRSALDEYRSVGFGDASDAQIEEGFAELQRAYELVELERLRWLAELDRRRSWLRHGHLSTTSWLARTHRVAHSAAAGDVRTARAMEAMPGTRDAVAAGDVSMSGARALVEAREADREAFSQSEPLLVEAATRHSVRDLQRVVAHWRDVVESRRRVEADEGPLRQRRRLHVSPAVFGMVRIDGDLDPETGETVLTALRAGWTQRPGRATGTAGPRPSAGPTPWGRSAPGT